MKHGLSASQAPTHAGAFQSVFHQVAAGSFGHATADGVSLRQVFIVPHMLSVVVVVRNGGLKPFAFLARQTARDEQLPEGTDHPIHFAFQQHPQVALDKLLGLGTRLGMKAVGRRPEPLVHVEQVQDRDCPDEPLFLKIPELPFAIH